MEAPLSQFENPVPSQRRLNAEFNRPDRSHAPWNSKEDQYLKERLDNGVKEKNLATELQRSRNAITARREKLAGIKFDLKLFHFTDTRNLESIRETGGLWSYAELKRKGIEPVAPGGSPSSHVQDHEQGLDEYVHLCLFPYHPMEYLCRTEGRIKQSHFIEISNKILESEGVLYAKEMANKQGVGKLPWIEAIEADEIGINIALLFHSMGAEEQDEICRIAQQIKAYTVSDEQIDSDIYKIARLVAVCIKQQLLVPKGITLKSLSLD